MDLFDLDDDDNEGSKPRSMSPPHKRRKVFVNPKNPQQPKNMHHEEGGDEVEEENKKQPSKVTSSTRVIVKNVPKHITLERLKQHFAQIANVTDCKLMATKYNNSSVFLLINQRRKITFFCFYWIQDNKRCSRCCSAL